MATHGILREAEGVHPSVQSNSQAAFRALQTSATTVPREKNVARLGSVQRVASIMVEQGRGKLYNRTPKEINLYSMEKLRFRSSFTETFKILRGLIRVNPSYMFRQATGGRTRSNDIKLSQPSIGYGCWQTVSAMKRSGRVNSYRQKWRVLKASMP